MTDAAAYVVGGLRVIRCYATPTENDDESVHWSIFGIPVDQAPEPDTLAVGTHRDLVLIGELVAHTSDEAVAVTAEAQISYQGVVPPGLVDDPAVGLAEVRRIGEDVRHLLYDLAANAGRTVAALTQLSVTIPLVTPEGKIELIEQSAREPKPATD
jgi:hypothetical protein